MSAAPVSSVEVARYRLPFREPVVAGGNTLRAREGLLVRVDGLLAEVAPLPGFSKESLEEAASWLEAGLAGDDAPAELPPSVSWGRAMLREPTLRAPDRGALTPVASAVLVQPGGVVPTAGTVKLKVGKRPLDEERRWVAAARKRAERIRLDGNRSLSADDARALAEAAGPSLDFFEEPTAPAALPELCRQLPIGLDESLLDAGPGLDGSYPAWWSDAAAWVVKPTLLGFERTGALLERGEALGIPGVLSGAYESAVGRAALERAAVRWAPGVVHGLGTGAFFAADLDDGALATLGWSRL